MLGHLGWGLDLRDFPGTTSERVALMRTASRRGLITWRKARGRYELTSVGWSELMPRRRFSLASLILSSVMGALVGAAALAGISVSADVPHHSVPRQSTAPLHRLAKPSAVATEHPVDLSVRETARPQLAVALVAPLVDPNEPALDAAPANPIEPPVVADGLVPEQPNAEAAPISAKQVLVKKPHHRTTYRHRKHRTRLARLSHNPRRVRQFRHLGYGDMNSQFAYR